MRTIIDLPEGRLAALDVWRRARGMSRAKAVRRAVRQLIGDARERRDDGASAFCQTWTREQNRFSAALREYMNFPDREGVVRASLLVLCVCCGPYCVTDTREDGEPIDAGSLEGPKDTYFGSGDASDSGIHHTDVSPQPDTDRSVDTDVTDIDAPMVSDSDIESGNVFAIGDFLDTSILELVDTVLEDTNSGGYVCRSGWYSILSEVWLPAGGCWAFEYRTVCLDFWLGWAICNDRMIDSFDTAHQCSGCVDMPIDVRRSDGECWRFGSNCNNYIDARLEDDPHNLRVGLNVCGARRQDPVCP